DRETGALWKLTENAQPQKLADLPPEAKSAEAFCGAAGADGTVFLGGSFGIFCLKNGAEWQKFADGLNVSGLTVLANGNLYATEGSTGKLWFFKADGSRQLAAENLSAPVGVGALPDGQWLDVMESGTHFGTSFKLEADGTPTLGQRIFWFHVPASEDGLGSGKCAFDADGKLYAATKLGVSVLDRNGRTRLILPSPLRGGQAFIDDLCFGGPDLHSLFILTEGQIFTRKVKPAGVPNFAPVQKLPKWGAG
ncbi:MAG: SMP-30/gluconolactonase/LRE family protein, partial [Thermoguttaceae bacterium]|nr:SMP-30/gluconolactonase/LRE family protein [Thermoguttaceae bacterium]